MHLPDTADWLTDEQVAAAAGGRELARRLPEGLPLLQPLVRWQLAGMFGIPDLGGDGPGPRSGLFGPESASRRLLAEPAAIAGGIRGLMVQAAHPLAMAGVAEHSRYRTEPLGRLEGTSTWVTATAYATVEVVHRQAARVRGMHQRVSGRWRGEPYAASDPRLLIWISIALTSSLLAADRLFAPDPLAGGERDRFVAEQGLAAALLDPRVDLEGLPPRDLPELDLRRLPLVSDGLPTDASELRESLRSFAAELEVTDLAREAIGFLLEVEVPALVRPVYRRFLLAVAATLPAPLRAALGLDARDPAARLRVLGRLLAGMRLTAGRSPSYERSARVLAHA